MVNFFSFWNYEAPILSKHFATPYKFYCFERHSLNIAIFPLERRQNTLSENAAASSLTEKCRTNSIWFINFYALKFLIFSCTFLTYVYNNFLYLIPVYFWYWRLFLMMQQKHLNSWPIPTYSQILYPFRQPLFNFFYKIFPICVQVAR